MLHIELWPSRQLRNRCIQSKISRYNLDRGWVECGANAMLTGSRWASNNYITQCHREFEIVGVSCSWSLSCSLRQWELTPSRGLVPSGPPVEQQSRMRKEVLLKTEELGVNMLPSVQSPTHLSHTTLSQPFRIKCERYIFLKKCVHLSLLLIMFPHVYVYSCICITAIQHLLLIFN